MMENCWKQPVPGVQTNEGRGCRMDSAIETEPSWDGPAPPVAVDDLLAEMRRRHAAGERPTAAEYLARFPDLLRVAEAASALIYQEFLLRQDGGGRSDLTPLIQQFPQYRADIECLFEADRFLGQDSLVGDPPAPPKGVGPSTSSGTRFRVLHPHARGGLGQISVALDTELNREVALKQLLDQRSDDGSSRGRFVREAEITGGLEHPGIIPVYGLGHDAAGRPYYAMRLIRGDSLADAIARFHQSDQSARDPGERALALRGLLGRLVAVCNTIEYAHSRGVLHRDLKPANVMLGSYGETLVVDWGLAKVMGRPAAESERREAGPFGPISGDTAATKLGTAAGTPAYMSPEQAAGKLERLGPTTDVYSLGAVLYCLLTGRAPFEGSDIATVLARARRGDFPAPRLVKTGVPRALEAICLKAMAREPAQRYATPRALSNDVERWLADEPVTAWSEPLIRRAGRWMRHHRTAVTTAAVAGLVLVGALGFGYWRELVHAASLDTQRRRAEDREQEAIAAVKRFGEIVSKNSDLKDRMELESLRKELLKEPLSFFKSLRGRLLSDGETRPEALARLGSASFELGHLTDEVGDKQDALVAHRESSEIFRKLAHANPSDTQFRFVLGRNLNNIGSLLRDTGRAHEALKSCEQALAIYQKLAETHPTNTRFQSALAESLDNVGILLSETGHPDEAQRSCEQALAIVRKLADAHPADTQFQGALATSYNNLGLLLSKTGRKDEALRSYERAVEIRRRLAEAHPADTRFQGALALSLNNIGVLLSDTTGGAAEALRSHQRALEIRQELAEAHPAVTQFQFDLAVSHNNIGVLQRDNGHADEALRSHERALAIRKKLAAEHPESPEYASNLGGSLNNLALLDLGARRFAQARDRLVEAIVWQKRALAADSRVASYRQNLGMHYRTLLMAAQGLQDVVLTTEARQGLAELAASDAGPNGLDARPTTVQQNLERLTLAQRAYDAGRHAAAARLWAETFAADPNLAADRQAQHLYNAACAAAQAATGGGIDSPPDAAAKARLRTQALGWLRSELATWKRFVETFPPDQRKAVAQVLAHWQQDPDLSSLRDPAALSGLPDDERSAWQALWTDVADLILITSGAKAPRVRPDLPAEVFAR
jgi:serine/threonine-protein kinase